MSQEVIATISVTVISALTGFCIWFMQDILQQNKEAHNDMKSDIKELSEGLTNLRVDLVKIGIIPDHLHEVRKDIKELQSKSIPEKVDDIEKKVNQHDAHFKKVSSVIRAHNLAIVKLKEEK